jgi:hypothetical protein
MMKDFFGISARSEILPRKNIFYILIRYITGVYVLFYRSSVCYCLYHGPQNRQDEKALACGYVLIAVYVLCIYFFLIDKTLICVYD